jgi:hypothetical protein
LIAFHLIETFGCNGWISGTIALKISSRYTPGCV